MHGYEQSPASITCSLQHSEAPIDLIFCGNTLRTFESRPSDRYKAMAAPYARAGIYRMTILRVRDFDAATAQRLAAEGAPAALARALAARGIASTRRPDWCWMD